VKNGFAEAKWKVAYKGEEDTDAEGEIKKQGYTIPAYCFVAEHNGEKSNTQSVELELKSVAHRRLVKKTGEVWKNAQYTITLTNGKVIRGTTDSEGYIEKVYLDYFARVEKIEVEGENA
jgi:hypothetical protein